MLKMIVAISENRGIGLGNKMPWNIRRDMKYFKKTTIGNGNNCVIMGKNTWNSFEGLKGEPLPKRDKIVMSRNELNILASNTQTAKNIDQVYELCNKKKYDDIWVIGGEKIYTSFLNKGLVDTVYITEILKNYECDTFFPELSNDFDISHTTEIVWENEVGMKFTIWEKREISKPGIIVKGLHAF
tara:strand:- start:435 stop:989 length:555 start_codon:yes stop_codon:yes gene_type:complete